MPACEINPVQMYSPERILDVRDVQAGAHANPDRADARGSEPDGGNARSGERVEPQRRADRNEEDDQQRQRARLDGGFQRVALRDGDVRDDDAGGHRGEQRLDTLAHADLAQQQRHDEKRQRHFAPDVSEIQREQRADETAEGDRAADFPREPHEHVHVFGRALPEASRAPAA